MHQPAEAEPSCRVPRTWPRGGHHPEARGWFWSRQARGEIPYIRLRIVLKWVASTKPVYDFTVPNAAVEDGPNDECYRSECRYTDMHQRCWVHKTANVLQAHPLTST